MYCSNCGKEINQNWMFCCFCGAKVQTVGSGISNTETTDIILEKEPRSEWKFCFYCGAKLNRTDTEEEEKAEKPMCMPGKRYACVAETEGSYGKTAQMYSKFQQESELGQMFYAGCFIVLEDGTQVGFVYQHAPKYKGMELKSYYFNLYRLDTDGTATFLNAGCSKIENFYILDNVAYCTGGTYRMEAKIDLV